MKSLLALLLSAMTICPTAFADDGRQGTIDPDFFTLKPETLDNPFTPWATPLAGGAIKALFIVPIPAAREVAELQRRLDLDAHTVMVKPHIGLPEGQLGFNPGAFGHYNSVAGFTQQEMIEQLNAALSQRADLIVIGNVDWSLLPEPIQQRIEAQVTRGAGLVLIHQTPESLEAWKAKINATASQPAAPDTVPVLKIQDLIAQAVPSTKRAEDGLWTGTLGKGRVAVFNWQEPPGHDTGRLSLRLAHALTPSWPISLYTRDGWAYEHEMGAVIKSLLWAADRAQPQQVAAIDLPASAPINEPTPAVLTVNASEPADMELDYRLRDLSNAIVAEQTIEVSVSQGSNRIEWPIVLPRGGTFSVDAILHKGGATVDFAAAVIETDRQVNLAITIDNPKRLPGDTLIGSVSVDNAEKREPIRLDVFDAKKRLLASDTITPDASGKATFSVQPVESLSAYNRIVATRLVNGHESEQTEAGAIVDRRAQTSKEYHITMWNWAPTDFLTTVFLNRYVELGIDSQYHNDYYKFEAEHLERGTWEAGRAGIEIVPYLWRDYAYAKEDLRDLERSPVLSSPEYRDSTAKTITSYTEIAAKFAAPFSTLGDEPYLVGFWDGVDGRDVCFAPETNASFRNYVRDKYGSLEKLNSVWGTSFTDWESVMPIIYEDAVEAGNLSRWIDHRQHMTAVFQGTLDFEEDVVNAIDPAMPTGPEGMYPWDPFKGYDFYRMAQMGVVGPYGTAHGELSQLACSLIAAFHAPDNRRYIITGWYNTMPRNAEYSKSDVWWSTFLGYNGMLYFLGDPGSTMSGFTPDHRPVKYLSDTLDAVRELRSGLFQLLQGTTRNDRDVAILYSDASYIASLSVNGAADPGQDAVFRTGKSDSLAPMQAAMWIRLLNDMGIPHTHVSTQQVEAGILQSDIRMLVLPVAMVLTDKEVEAIRAFVQSGGIVVADVLPGVLDGNGAPREGGSLDDLFGVRQSATQLSTINQQARQRAGTVTIEQAGQVALAGASAGATVAQQPVFTSHAFGAGHALLANTTLRNYEKLRKDGTNASFVALLDEWFASAGFQKEFTLSVPRGSAPVVEMIPYIDGNLHYIAVQKQPKYVPAGSSSFAVQLPGEFVVYDVRAGEALGRVDHVTGSVTGDEPKFYALLPYEVLSLSAYTRSSTVARGQRIEIDASIITSEGPAGRHVVYYEATSPDGIVRYSGTVNLQAGEGTIAIPIALNDATGTWTIASRDVISGKSASVAVDLK